MRKYRVSLETPNYIFFFFVFAFAVKYYSHAIKFNIKITIYTDLFRR